MYRQESIWKTTKKKYEIMTCTTKIHYFIFWSQVNYYFKSSFIITGTHPMQICVITSYAMVRYYLKISEISAGAPKIDRKWNHTYNLMCREESIYKKRRKKKLWRDNQNSLHFLFTGSLSLLKSLYYKTHGMQIWVITSYAVAGTIYNLIVYKERTLHKITNFKKSLNCVTKHLFG